LEISTLLSGFIETNKKMVSSTKTNTQNIYAYFYVCNFEKKNCKTKMIQITKKRSKNAASTMAAYHSSSL